MMAWQTKKLGDILERIEGGGTPNKDCDSYWNGDIAWASVKDIVSFDPFSTKDNITKEGLINSSSRLIKNGTLIISTRMALGCAVRFKIDVAINQDLKAVYPQKTISTSFLHKWFDFSSAKIQRIGSGSTVSGIQVNDLKKMVITFPGLAEQERIVGVLEVWDEYLEKLERKIKLKQIAKNYIARKIFNNNSFVPLKNIASKRRNAIVDGPFGSQMKVSEFVGYGVPVIEMHHLNNNAIDTNKITRFVEVKKFEKDLKRSGVKAGDIVISKTGSLGYVGLYLGRKEAVITSRLAKITIDKKKADVDFMLEYLSFIQQLKHWEKVGQGGTMKILSIKHLENLPVPDIDISKQEQLGEIIKTISFEMQLLKSKKYQIEQQKKFLLKKLVSGELRTPEDILEKGVSR